MPFWVFVIIVVAVVTCGRVVQTAIEAFSPKPRSLPGPDSAAADEEVLRLREQVETLSEQVGRLQEEQRFLTRLLEDRPPGRLEARSRLSEHD